MSATLPPVSAPDIPHFKPRIFGIGLLVAAIVVTGFFLVGKFNNLELSRDIQAWQEKLNLIAESRTADVNGWVAGNFRELRNLADNPSLQLYLTELQSTGMAEAISGEPSQKAYLRNVLLFTAERAGYGSGNAIPANVQPEAKRGLAIINKDGEVVVSTVMPPHTRDVLLEHARQSTPGQETLIDIQPDKDGTPFIGFIVPVYAIQGDKTPNAQIGKIIGIKTLDDAFFHLLKHPGATEKTLEAILLRRAGDKLEYLSPLHDGTSTIGKQQSYHPTALAEAKLVENTGSFTSSGKDYNNRAVLATSRAVAATPWTLIVKIDQQEALAKSNQRRASMIMFFSLIILSIVLIVFAIWWYAHSRRAMFMSGYFKKLATKAVAQEQLLRLVTDNQPEPIYILDKDSTYRFANRQASGPQMSPDSLDGKPLADVRGAARAAHIESQCDKAMKHRHIHYDVQRTAQGRQEKVIRSAYIPLDHIPIAALPEPTPGVLVVEQDISEVVHEREQRINTQRHLVNMLVKLVDKRDPFAANHSQLVSEVAYEIAVDMELDNNTVEAASTAGSLMNIGKIVVPAELLTKTESLTREEKAIIRDSMTAAAELLKDIRFDGPVLETLRQWQEKWDGSGPLGLKGESILISARIIAVANAFIGMISPRSWRDAMTIADANTYLLDQSGKDFDRKVVIALINFVENHNGEAWLKKALEEKKSVA